MLPLLALPALLNFGVYHAPPLLSPRELLRKLAAGQAMMDAKQREIDTLNVKAIEWLKVTITNLDAEIAGLKRNPRPNSEADLKILTRMRNSFQSNLDERESVQFRPRPFPMVRPRQPR